MIQDTRSYERPQHKVAVSIISHGHGALISSLLQDLACYCRTDIRVILTLNVAGPTVTDPGHYPFALTVIRNETPKGFAANHNAALAHVDSPYFCVLNPDIRLAADPFPPLIAELQSSRVGVAAPRILNPNGNTEDSARRFPTPFFLLRKLLGLARNLDYQIGDSPLSPDWVAGMFMIFRSEVYAELDGFDERYFLYYEDVDLCRRLRQRGYDVRLVPSVTAVHDARRESRRSLRHLRWHLASMLRFLITR